MLTLVYVSSAARPFSDDELIALLKHCRDKNARLGITGMLLYKDGNFMQALEGPDDVVRQVFRSILADARHRGVMCLLERPTTTRQFSGWSMAFRNLNDPALREIPGYDEFMNEPLYGEGFQANPDHAHRLLDLFRRSLL